MLRGNVLDLPLELRANDITCHVINIDSRFRTNSLGTSSDDFYYRLRTPVRNVLRVRITSIEFPNAYPVFTAARKSTSLRFMYFNPPTSKKAVYTDITIPDGNYSVADMVNELNEQFIAKGLAWLTTTSIGFDTVTGKFTFTGTQQFGIDTTYNSYIRPYNYGLGFNLGFSQKTQIAIGPDLSGNWTLTSDQCAYFAGDNYIFLKINNFDCVRQQTDEEDFTAMAKIILRDSKTFMTFDDYNSQLVKEVIFPSPVDLTRFHIQLLDPYGQLLDMCSSQFSFSMEVLEVKNSSMYNTIRDSLYLRYI